MQATPHAGVFVVIEGLDRAGKTTCTKKLQEAIHRENPDVKIQLYSYPTRRCTSPAARMIGEHLHGEMTLAEPTLSLLFAIDRLEHQSTLRSQIEQSDVTIVDRYVLSGIAYAKARGVPDEMAEVGNTTLLNPHITFYLDVDPLVASEREGYGSEAHDDVTFQTRVRGCYQEALNSPNSWMFGRVVTLSSPTTFDGWDDVIHAMHDHIRQLLPTHV